MKNKLTIHWSVILSCVLAGLVVCLTNAALSWDGATYFFNITYFQRPYIVANRLAEIIIQLPTVLVVWISQNEALSRFVFNLSNFLPPWICLGVVAYALRGEKLFSLYLCIATVMILLMPLPGQFFFVSEAALAAQVFSTFWVVFLARGFHFSLLPLYSTLILLALYSHPATAMLLIAGGLSILIALILSTSHQRNLKSLFGGLCFITLGVSVKIFSKSNLYEEQHLSQLFEIERWPDFIFQASSFYVLILGLLIGLARYIKASRLNWYVATFVLLLLSAPFLAFFKFRAPGNEWHMVGTIAFRVHLPLLMTWPILLSGFYLKGIGILESDTTRLSTVDLSKIFSDLSRLSCYTYCASLIALCLVWHRDLSSAKDYLSAKPFQCYSLEIQNQLPVPLRHWSFPHLVTILRIGDAPIFLPHGPDHLKKRYSLLAIYQMNSWKRWRRSGRKFIPPREGVSLSSMRIAKREAFANCLQTKQDFSPDS